MADLDYVKVIGRLGLTVGDSANDVDEDPDVLWCDSGEITFTPLITTAKVLGALPVPVTLGNSAIKAGVDSDGYLSYLGRKSVNLVDLTSTKVNPRIGSGKATHKVDFKNIKAGGAAVSFASFTGRFAADTVDGNLVCDLTKLSPLPVAGAVSVVVGPAGKSITSMRAVGNTLLYTIDGVEMEAGTLPAGSGATDEVVAEYLQLEGGSSSTYLQEEFGDSSLQDFVAKCEAGNSDVNLLVISDSTAAAAGGWVEKSLPQIAQRFPHLTVSHRKWADGTPGSYSAAVTISGTGTRTLNVWNASAAGKTWQYHADVSRWPTMLGAATFDAAVISLGHNDNPAALHTNNTGPQKAKALVFIEFMRTLMASTAFVLMSQNPLLVANQTLSSQNRADMLRGIARVRGFGFIDVTKAFTDDGRSMSLLVGADNVHPTDAGYTLWSERFMDELRVKPKGRVTGQSTPSFSIAPANLIGDPTFKNYASGVLPTGWSFTNISHTKNVAVFETDAGSLDLTKTAAGATAFIDYTVPNALTKGRVVTAMARLYVPASSPGLTGQVTIRNSLATPGSETWGQYDQWFWRSMTALVPAGSTLTTFRLFVDPTNGSALQNIKLDRVALFIGELPMDPYSPAVSSGGAGFDDTSATNEFLTGLTF